MDMLEHFRRLFAYDDWANREVLAALRQNQNARALELLAHIFAAQRVWLVRLLQEKQPVVVWPEFTAEQCDSEVAELAQSWRKYLAAMTPDGLQQMTSYQNTKGEPFTSRTDDILMHVIMHAAYHRGQIATHMRAAGSTPAYTDFIHAVRQGFVE